MLSSDLAAIYFTPLIANMLKILNIAGARPNFVKIAPLMHQMLASAEIEPKIIHTGQHYDRGMSQVFFDDLNIPPPDRNLGVGSGTREDQIDRIMSCFDQVVQSERPDIVLVVGDVNSTIACASVARRRDITVAHVESGLRSFDLAMPEEINRVETDKISDLLFVTEPSGMTNLANEGVPGRAFLVGNVMIDSLVAQLAKAEKLHKYRELNLDPQSYFIGTFHRPSNVDELSDLTRVLEVIRYIAARNPLVLPLHPRTKGALERFGLLDELAETANVVLTDPMSYLEFLSLIQGARCVVTDSGGVQEETTFLRVPCITMRTSTERPVTVDVGSNTLVGTEVAAVVAAVDQVLEGPIRTGEIPELWDGHAAERITGILLDQSVW